MSEKKRYKLNRPLLLRPQTAEMLGVDDRWFLEGEEIELPDPIAEPLLKKGSIELFVPPKPAAKKQTKKPVSKEIE